MHAPEQLPIDGVPPAVQTFAPEPGLARLGDQAPHLAVLGDLVGPAIVRGTQARDVLIEATLHQAVEHHPQAVPVLARWAVPDQGGWLATHEWATERVRHINAAVAVIVVAQGIEPGHHAGQAVLRLLHVRAIKPAVDGRGDDVATPATPNEVAHAH